MKAWLFVVWLVLASISISYRDLKFILFLLSIIACAIIYYLIVDWIKEINWKAVTDFIFFAILMCLGLGLMISGINKSAWLIVFGLLFISIGLIFFFKKKSA